MLITFCGVFGQLKDCWLLFDKIKKVEVKGKRFAYVDFYYQNSADEIKRNLILEVIKIQHIMDDTSISLKRDFWKSCGSMITV